MSVSSLRLVPSQVPPLLRRISPADALLPARPPAQPVPLHRPQRRERDALHDRNHREAPPRPQPAEHHVEQREGPRGELAPEQVVGGLDGGRAVGVVVDQQGIQRLHMPSVNI